MSPKGVYVRTDKIKKILTDTHKGKIVSNETRKKISVANKGIKLTDEHKKKLSDAKKGEKHWNYGKHLSDEHKKKLSDIKKGKHQDSKFGEAYKRFKQKKKEILEEIKKIENGKKNPVFHTWEVFCLIKLKKIGKSTIKEWGEAMKYNCTSMIKVINRITDKLKITEIPESRLKFYEVKDGVVL